MQDLRKEIEEDENASSDDSDVDSSEDESNSGTSGVKEDESSPLASPSVVSSPSEKSPVRLSRVASAQEEKKQPTEPKIVSESSRVMSPPSIVSRSKKSEKKDETPKAAKATPSDMRKREKEKDKKKAKKSGGGGGGAGLRDIAYKLKLSQLKISSKQMYRFATRIGRRLIRNEIFINKLAEQLDDMPISETSEQREERWGLEHDEGATDLRGYVKKYWVKHE